VTALTAQQGIDDALHLKAGETVSILGASGGVGTLAVQFAKLRGARVLAIASGYDGISLLQRLGADAAIVAAKLQVPIAAKYPLAAAGEAQQRIAAGHVLGKLVLRIR